MGQYAVKIVVTVLVIVAASEIGKRSTFWAAVLASLPLTSVLAMVWLYVDTKDIDRVAALSQSIVWMVVPSLLLLLVLPMMLRSGFGFWSSLLAGCVTTASAYVVMARVLEAFDVHL